ncbi:MAG: hypothetical protein RLZZ519_1795 [Bacteroidota bacterium]|jgi:hypothetical protein
MAEMDSLQINLWMEGRVIGTAADVHVGSNRNGMQTVRLMGVTLVDSFGWPKGGELQVQIKLQDKEYERLHLSPVNAFQKVPQKPDWVAKYPATVIGPWFDPLEWAILRGWAKDGESTPNWTALGSRKKRAWNTACLHWSGIREEMDPLRQLLIDGSCVTSKVDLYCHLGEVFFGERGYMGQDLDGLHDCLISLGNRSKATEDNRIIFRNLASMQKALDTPSNLARYRRPYTGILIEILTNAGFQIQFEP